MRAAEAEADCEVIKKLLAKTDQQSSTWYRLAPVNSNI